MCLLMLTFMYMSFKANELGVGVVGVCEVDFLEPIHNKQDFNKNERYK